MILGRSLPRLTESGRAELVEAGTGSLAGLCALPGLRPEAGVCARRRTGNEMTFGWTFQDQVMALVAGLSALLAIWVYFYTHPRKKQ